MRTCVLYHALVGLYEPVPLCWWCEPDATPYHGKTRDRFCRCSVVALGYPGWKMDALMLSSESVGVQAVGALGQARLKGDDLRGLDR